MIMENSLLIFQRIHLPSFSLCAAKPKSYVPAAECPKVKKVEHAQIFRTELTNLYFPYLLQPCPPASLVINFLIQLTVKTEVSGSVTHIICFYIKQVSKFYGSLEGACSPRSQVDFLVIMLLIVSLENKRPISWEQLHTILESVAWNTHIPHIFNLRSHRIENK